MTMRRARRGVDEWQLRHNTGFVHVRPAWHKNAPCAGKAESIIQRRGSAKESIPTISMYDAASELTKLCVKCEFQRECLLDVLAVEEGVSLVTISPKKKKTYADREPISAVKPATGILRLAGVDIKNIGIDGLQISPNGGISIAS